MIATCNYTAKVCIFYTFADRHIRRSSKAAEYLKRHGWSECGGLSGYCEYQKVEFAGYDDYKKSFDNIEQMNEEIANINDAFNDGYREEHGDGSSTYHSDIEPYNKKRFRLT